jgi:hypothetical protein
MLSGCYAVCQVGIRLRGVLFLEVFSLAGGFLVASASRLSRFEGPAVFALSENVNPPAARRRHEKNDRQIRIII